MSDGKYEDLVEEFLKTKWKPNQIVISTLTILGILINSYAVIFLHRTKHKGIFVRLLKSLVVSDIIVELTCGILWGIPRGVDEYSRNLFPKLAPILIAISHMAVLTSNLITGVIGFERYVRLKYMCNFKYRSWITNKNINIYRAAVILFPILFYSPKFFEIESYPIEIQCTKTFLRGHEYLQRFSQRLLIEDRYSKLWTEDEVKTFLRSLNYSSDPLDELFDVKELKNIWECWKLLKKDKRANLTYHDIRATELRQNWKYYHLYYMGANTIFGHFLPFVLLVVLNILIMWTLRQNKQSSIVQNDSQQHHQLHSNTPSEFSSALTRHFTIKISRASMRMRRSFYRNQAVSSPAHNNNNNSCATAPATTTILKVPHTPKSPTLTPRTFELPSSELQFIDECDQEDSQQISNGVTKPQFTLPVEDNGRIYKQRHPLVTEFQINRNGLNRSATITRIPSQNGLIRHGGSATVTARETKLTFVSFYIMLMYLFCHIWKFIPNVFEAIRGMEKYPNWLHWINDLSHLMVVINSAFNFLPYLWFKNSKIQNQREVV